MNLRTAWVLLLIAAPMAVLHCAVPRMIELIEVNVGEESIAVSFRLSSSAGIPVTQLSDEGLTLELGDSLLMPVRVESRPPSIRTNVILMLDASGSMEGQPLADAREAAITFVRSMGHNDHGRIFAFAEGMTVQTPLTSNHDELVRAIHSIQPQDDTAMYDALYDNLVYLERASKERNTILLLTDGKDTASSLTLDDVLEKARTAGVPIYAVGLGTEMEPRERRRVLERLARLTGGEYYQAPSSRDLVAIYSGISKHILEIHSATFLIPKKLRNGSIERLILRYQQDGVIVKDFVDAQMPELRKTPIRLDSGIVLLGGLILLLLFGVFAAGGFWLLRSTDPSRKMS